MTPSQSKIPGWTVALALGLVVVLVGGVFVRQQLGRTGESYPVISGINDFTLTNHLGQVVGLGDLRGRISVASVIFTRCPGPCLAMSRKFAKLQTQLRADDSVRLWSFTVDPEFDTPEVLAVYADKLGTDAQRWWFLTGANSELRRLAIRDFKFAVLDKDAAEQESEDDLFIHSTYFMILDERARVRAVIEGAEEDAVEKTLAAIARLRSER